MHSIANLQEEASKQLQEEVFKIDLVQLEEVKKTFEGMDDLHSRLLQLEHSSAMPVSQSQDEEPKCLECHTNPTNVMFIPCGHL